MPFTFQVVILKTMATLHLFVLQSRSACSLQYFVVQIHAILKRNKGRDDQQGQQQQSIALALAIGREVMLPASLGARVKNQRNSFNLALERIATTSSPNTHTFTMLHQRVGLTASRILARPIVQASFRRNASSMEQQLSGPRDNAFNRERLAVKHHAEATAGVYYLFSLYNTTSTVP